MASSGGLTDLKEESINETNAETANGQAELNTNARPDSPTPQEAAKEASTAEDSDATVRSTSEDTSQPSTRYGLRPKRSRVIRGGSLDDEGRDAKKDQEGDPGEDAQNVGKHRRKRSQTGKQSDANKQDGLLRLAQIAHANPRLPKRQRGDKAGTEGDAGGQDGTETSDPAVAPATAGTAATSNNTSTTVIAEPPVVPAETIAAAPAEQSSPSGLPAQAAGGLNSPQAEQRITPTQIRAVLLSGQQLTLPGFHPGPLPHVQMGARWQLDLRTGERLEEQPAPPMGMSLMQGVPGPSGFQMPAGSQPLGPRPPIFTGAGPQGPQMPGGYGVVPPPTNYAGSLPIPALGQQPLSQGLTPAGPYTALLGNQMQPLLPPGVLPGQYPAGFHGMPHGTPQPQQIAAVPPKKRQRSSHAAELADLPEIPLRRRGRPAGDGTTAAASPQELQERRMQANRAAASRSHFRRKREMEILEKECATLESQVLEVRNNLANLMAQEEQLRLQQAGIREHLATGCNQPPAHIPHQHVAADSAPKADG